MTLSGKSGAVCQAPSDGPAAGRAPVPAPATALAALPDSGEKAPRTVFSGAPAASTRKPPDCSPSFSAAGAPPVFFTFRFLAADFPQPTEALADAGVTVNRPALSLKSARTALSAPTFTVLDSGL
ncbi:hypothetical protein [Actinacidiphila sp. ITFR-21]|uniref:hypothetical protein n=1 Tax=Actinacidiphila sp. ITFR-21 TaxID=3075199 RepID=UPI0028892B7B|nr:hypothetical protein [Streptomyces sp. ITFR-21]WNI17552.1 hypothetical protein RLT57_19875 [Streptomyces sp. ITFR-21]